MKNFMYAVLAFLLMGSQMTLMAQENDKVRKQRPTPEQVMQMQTDQMIKVLMLDDDTAAKFTPVYQNYLKELNECRMMNRKPRAPKEGVEKQNVQKQPKQPMTDDEIAKMLKAQFEQSRKMLDIREKYYNELSNILTQKQIMKIYQQEKNNANKFKKELNRRNDQKKEPGKRPQEKR